jgi:hypothetical protein
MIDLAQFMKNLYENPQIINYVSNNYVAEYKRFVHISDTVTRYCPRTWSIAEKMVNDIMTKASELSKVTELLRDID